ncbi:hypothetical protein [Bradyrhizobium japonicum]|uniref:hypothetical protein n=1 Tax=Bradyrhizobium japonicum TaxID=375 RepID=UPI002714E36C|nr:hypothetical protein [Bradyrhizobium japonicum]WLB24493.1 hypothetical protein QIH95_51045 [Bradyrhizobium japonicum]
MTNVTIVVALIAARLGELGATMMPKLFAPYDLKETKPDPHEKFVNKAIEGGSRDLLFEACELRHTLRL